MMSLFINQAKEILNNWKTNFDVASNIVLDLREENGSLYINEFMLTEICPISLQAAGYNAKKISFSLDGNRQIQINISWPNNEIPYVKAAFFLQLKAS